MTVTSKVLLQGKLIEATQVSQYPSTNVKSIVDGAIASNISSAAVLLSVWLVPSQGAPSDANKIIDAVPIGAHSAYLCPELAGRRLDAGDAIYTQADTGGAISLRLDGRVVTA